MYQGVEPSIFFLDLNIIIRSGHIFARYTTAQLSRHVQNCDVVWQLHLKHEYVDGLVQDCSNSIANALELLQSSTQPLILGFELRAHRPFVKFVPAPL